MAAGAKSTSVGGYIKSLNPEARRVVNQLRQLVAAEMPQAREMISYNILAFAQPRPFMYCAGFKGHVGVYPPVQDDARLRKALAPYSNKKGNLRFPLDEPMPWPQLRRVVKALARQYAARAKDAADP